MTPAAGLGFKAEHFARGAGLSGGGAVVRSPRRKLHGRRRSAPRHARGDSRRGGRFRSTASACRWPVRPSPIPNILPRSSGSSTGSSPCWCPSISPGRASTGAASPTCCPSRAPTRRWRRLAANIDRVQDALGRADPDREPVALSRACATISWSETSFLLRARAAQRLRAADRRQQRRRQREQSRLRSRRLSRRDSAPSGSAKSTSPATRSTPKAHC